MFGIDWESAPGETIKDTLKSRNWSIEHFSELTGFTTEFINDLIAGKATIDEKVAKTLSYVIGGSIDFWLSREKKYREYLDKLSTKTNS